MSAELVVSAVHRRVGGCSAVYPPARIYSNNNIRSPSSCPLSSVKLDYNSAASFVQQISLPPPTFLLFVQRYRVVVCCVVGG